jgi:hypothetical protein
MTVELLFGAGCEPADLDAVQATDTVIRKDTMARNSFIPDMMPRSAGQYHPRERVDPTLRSPIDRCTHLLTQVVLTARHGVSTTCVSRWSKEAPRIVA